MEKFWSRVNKTETCWLWMASKNSGGYGYFYYKGKRTGVHRITYELFKGLIPKGLQIDHLCRVRNCVNPEHMEAVTHRENTLRGIGLAAINARKTHCPKGHPLSGDNLYQPPSGGRKCRICNKRTNAIWQKIFRPRKCKEGEDNNEPTKTTTIGR